MKQNSYPQFLSHTSHAARVKATRAWWLPDWTVQFSNKSTVEISSVPARGSSQPPETGLSGSQICSHENVKTYLCRPPISYARPFCSSEDGTSSHPVSAVPDFTGPTGHSVIGIFWVLRLYLVNNNGNSKNDNIKSYWMSTVTETKKLKRNSRICWYLLGTCFTSTLCSLL